MANNKCLDIILIIYLASFVSITLPISYVVITDYKETRKYSEGLCNGSTLTNYTVDGGFFFHGRVNVVADVNGTQYNGYLYYPPIKHWQLGVMPREGVDDWYDSLNKTGGFPCFVDVSNPSHPMVNEWIEVIVYCIMFIMCLFIISGWSVIGCIAYDSRKQRNRYIYIPTRPKSLYKSLNDELTTISV